MKTKQFFKEYWDILLLIPILYGLIATVINSWILHKEGLGSFLPSLWFSIGASYPFWIYLLLAITAIGIIASIYKAYNNKKSRVLRVILSIVSILWILFVYYMIKHLTFNAGGW